MKIRSSKQLFSASTLFSLSFLISSSQLAAPQCTSCQIHTTLTNDVDRPEEMLKCWDKLSRSGRAGQLNRRGSWLVAVNGQRSLLLVTFLCRFICFDFYHDPQARWSGDPRILNTTEPLSSFMLSMVGNSAYMERVRPQLCVSMEMVVSLIRSLLPHHSFIASTTCQIQSGAQVSWLHWQLFSCI